MAIWKGNFMLYLCASLSCRCLPTVNPCYCWRSVQLFGAFCFERKYDWGSVIEGQCDVPPHHHVASVASVLSMDFSRALPVLSAKLSIHVCSFASYSDVKMSSFYLQAKQSSAHKTNRKKRQLANWIRKEHFVMIDLVKCNPLLWYWLLLICWRFLQWICHHAGALRRFINTASETAVLTVKSYFTYICHYW